MDSIITQDMKEIISYNNDLAWDNLKNSTVLITGANGMIASYFIYLLMYLNDEKAFNIKIIGLVRNQVKAKVHFKNILERKDVSLIVQDICNPIKYAGPVDFVLHAASQTSPAAFRDNPVGTIKGNTLGTINVLDFAVEKKVRGVLYLSTREIYGSMSVDKEFVIEEEYGIVNPTEVRSCYPESKRMAENMCVSYVQQYHVPVKIARIAHTYGPGMPIGDGRVISDFFGNVLRNEDIVLNSEGNTLLAPTYLADIIAGLFRHWLNDGEMICNISSDLDILSVKQLADKLCKIFSDRHLHVKYIMATAYEKNGYLKNKVPFLSSDKMYAKGWHPRIRLEDGIKRSIKFFMDR